MLYLKKELILKKIYLLQFFKNENNTYNILFEYTYCHTIIYNTQLDFKETSCKKTLKKKLNKLIEERFAELKEIRIRLEKLNEETTNLGANIEKLYDILFKNGEYIGCDLDDLKVKNIIDLTDIATLIFDIENNINVLQKLLSKRTSH